MKRKETKKQLIARWKMRCRIFEDAKNDKTLTSAYRERLAGYAECLALVIQDLEQWNEKNQEVKNEKANCKISGKCRATNGRCD